MRTRAADAESALFLLALLAAAALFFRGFSRFFPLDPYDEAFYLFVGTRHAPLIIDWGPLYSRCYTVLHWIWRDPVGLFYANVAFQTTALAALHFLLSRRLGVSPLYSFLGAYFVLIWGMNAPVVPKVNHFNVLCFYALFLAVSFIENASLAVAVMALISLPLIYVRPDDILICPVFLIYWAFMVWRGGEPAPRRLLKLGAGVAGFAAAFEGLLRTIGSPYGTDRAWGSFQDFFLWDRFGARAIDRGAKMRLIFGPAHGIIQAARANPGAILEHVAGNLAQWPSALSGWLSGHFPVFDHGASPFGAAARLETAALGIALCLFSLTRARKRGPGAFVRSSHPWLAGAFGAFLGACAMRAACLTTLLSPWMPRYWLEFFFAALLAVFAALDFSSGKKEHPACLLIALPLLVLCPRLGYPGLCRDCRLGGADEKAVVAFLRTLPVSASSRWFGAKDHQAYFSDSADGRPFAGDQWDYLLSGRLARPRLSDYLDAKGFDVIIDEPNVVYDLQRLHDPGDGDALRDYLRRRRFREVFAAPSGVTVYVSGGKGGTGARRGL